VGSRRFGPSLPSEVTILVQVFSSSSTMLCRSADRLASFSPTSAGTATSRLATRYILRLAAPAHAVSSSGPLLMTSVSWTCSDATDCMRCMVARNCQRQNPGEIRDALASPEHDVSVQPTPRSYGVDCRLNFLPLAVCRTVGRSSPLSPHLFRFPSDMASLVSKLPSWRRSLTTVHLPPTSTTSAAVGWPCPSSLLSCGACVKRMFSPSARVSVGGTIYGACLHRLAGWHHLLYCSHPRRCAVGTRVLFTRRLRGCCAHANTMLCVGMSFVLLVLLCRLPDFLLGSTGV